MIDTIYIEDQVAEHPRALRVLDRFRRARVVRCRRYTEVFNPAAQNFRLQKRNPALVLARKRGRLVHDVPAGFGIDEGPCFYFSHLLNCPYDCRYCFLQGMFRSAHYVLFVNYEDFEAEIETTLARSADKAATFCSGYDCDSLALESVTGFVERFAPFFAARPKAVLELRTKSVATRALRALEPVPNVVVAFSFTPPPAADAVEHGTPPVAHRIDAAEELAAAGWPLGLRLDPLLWFAGWRRAYGDLIEELAARLPAAALHSVSIGPLRFPATMFSRIERLYPDDLLLSGPLGRREDFVSYSAAREDEITDFVLARLAEAFPDIDPMPCSPAGA